MIQVYSGHVAKAREYPGLDVARLFAALSVATYHFAYFHPTRGMSLPLYQWADWGWCGVQIFFVMSGFVIALSASGKTGAEFAFSRARRLYPAAWICASLSMIVAPRPLGDYLRSLTLFPVGPYVNGVYWTLPIEIAFYGLVTLSLWRRWSLHTVALALGWFSAAYWTLRCFGIDFPIGPFGHYGCYFAFGMLLFERRSAPSAAAFFIAGFIGVAHMAGSLGFGYLAPFVWAAMTLLCVPAAQWNVHIPLARTLGLMTYPLYLLHDSIGTPLLKFSAVAALAASLLIAFAVLPLERAIRQLNSSPSSRLAIRGALFRKKIRS